MLPCPLGLVDPMKRVEAIIPAQRLDDVKDRLTMIGLPGMTLHVVWGSIDQPVNATYRGAAGQTDFASRVRLDIVVDDDFVESVVNAIILRAHTGQPDDGKIFITPLDEVIRIRTGEMGRDAI